jgi:hypothetical protein
MAIRPIVVILQSKILKKDMRQILIIFFFSIGMFTAFGQKMIEKNDKGLIEKNFDQFHYVYHFYKEEFTRDHIDPTSYKPKMYDIGNTIRAQLFNKDTLIRFVFKSKSNPADSAVELFRPAKLDDMKPATIPSDLLGCRFLGIYNSSNEDVPENFYFCFYLNGNGDLLKVTHLYKAGNVLAAFFYTKDSIDPTIRYKNDVAKLLAVDRPLDLTDSVRVKIQ